MASRYLRASGNWNGPVWAATSGGAAGSAATPTASDDVFINSANAYTVTLTANATAQGVVLYRGRINLSQWELSCNSFQLLNSLGGARTLDIGSGTLSISDIASTGDVYAEFTQTGTTIIPGTGLVEISPVSTSYLNFMYLYTGSHTFPDFVINLGDGIEDSSGLNITGSPIFRSLIIQSKNSAAHTVNFDDYATITTDKFVATGSSSSNKLQLTSSETAYLNITDGGSCYGQSLAIGLFQKHPSGSDTPLYMGSNSTKAFGVDWLLQDPPKISTLVDPLTEDPGENDNWAVTGTVTQVMSGHDGGGYSVSGSVPV